MNAQIFLNLEGLRPVSSRGLGSLQGQRGIRSNLSDPLDLTLDYMPPGPSTIEVLDDDDDDLVIISPTAFQQAINSSRTRRTRATDVESVEIAAHNQQIPFDLNMQPPNENTEGTSNSRLPVAPVAPPPPPQPTHTCPICLGPIDEETTTPCGHLFCLDCIRSSVAVREMCPICRGKVTYRELIKLYYSDPI